LITIDPKSGILTLDEYQFSPYETIDKLLVKYPNLQLKQESLSPSYLPFRVYTILPSDLDTRRIEIQVTLMEQYIGLITLSRLYRTHKGRNNYSDKKLLDWVKKAQEWLIEELGQAHEIESGILFDEDKHFNASELEFFKSWKYEFDWGTAGFYYDGLQEPGDIFIDYNYHYQIKSWDELLLQCDYIESEAQKYQLINRGNIQAVRDLINLIRDEFDYMTVRPMVGVQNLHFEPKALHPTFVTVIVDVHYPDKLYHVNRTDMANDIFTSDKDTLLKGLKEFLRTKP
jgi:hypothetical protein